MQVDGNLLVNHPSLKSTVASEATTLLTTAPSSRETSDDWCIVPAGSQVWGAAEA